MPEASTHMTVGAPAVAPRGYVQFCERQPGDCGASHAELEQMKLASTGSSTAVAAIAFDWTRAFAEAKAQRAAQPARAATPGLASYDWSRAFPTPGLQRISDARPRTTTISPPTRDAREAGGAPVALSAATWSLLTKTNDAVNRAIAERSDQEIYGVSELWATPLEAGLNAGDCEDYVLEKRRALLQGGVPASALSIAVVGTSRGLTHAVLLVATDKGDYVLDNLSAWVLPWQKTPYQWRERQVDGSPSQWAFASGAAAPQPAATDGLLLASLR
ncbi:transglutaminase-like cysteine peptidase [Phenylobacterium sp.]|jgi:predicted transglutaminase-like cysteine proteinase|uniref:transglutaminase-like cysteine peptidase n=1 Tax=Phenylobacterium sp. TaxID=1871053 RepID=UPI002F931E42